VLFHRPLLWASPLVADSGALQLERGLLAHAPTRVDASAYEREAGSAYLGDRQRQLAADV
jgi:hypothetical protein